MWLLLGLTVYAQEAPTLSSLELSLWPEYDKPAVLVIYQAEFAADTTLPAAVEIRIPARVGAPTALAYVDELGQRFNQAYTTQQEGDWTLISFSLETNSFQLEYYDTLAIDSSGKRSYAFDYVADYPVTTFLFKVQVPPTAQSFVLDPAASSVTPEMDGLVYHSVQVDSMAQAAARGWSFSYQKDNSDLTQPPSEATAAPAMVAPATAATTGNSTGLIVVVGLVSLVMVGAGAYWLGRNTQVRPAPAPVATQSAKRRGSGRGSAPRPRPSEKATDPEMLYCYRCGTQMRSDSQFCHKCGAAVRGKDE